MESLAVIKNQIHDAVNLGVDTVEEIHTSMFNQPLNVLEKIEGLEETAKKVKEVHQQTFGTIYNAIRSINNTVGEFTSGLMEKAEATS